MREIIKKVLAEWLVELSQRDDKLEVLGSADSEISGEEEEDRLFWVDRHLMGVALFLAEVAEQANDMELLGLAIRAKKIAKEKIDEDSKTFQEDTERAEIQRMKSVAVDSACQEFFKSLRLPLIDMSQHQQAIEAARPYFSNPRDYLDLLSYIDERKMLKRFKLQVKESVRQIVENHIESASLPPDQWMQDNFEAVLLELYRRADRYVAQQLKRFAPQSLIPPIGTDEKT